MEKADRCQPGRQEKNKADKNIQALDRHRQFSHKHIASIKSSHLSGSPAILLKHCLDSITMFGRFRARAINTADSN